MNLGGPLKYPEQTENKADSLIPMHLWASFL